MLHWGDYPYFEYTLKLFMEAILIYSRERLIYIIAWFRTWI